MEVLSEFTLSQSIAWLKNLNYKLIERVELIESIIAKDNVEESDIERLRIIDKNHYTNWEISELPLDYDNLDLCLTIYKSTISDALNKYEKFFDYQNNREFESHQYYLSKFISYNIEADFFIHYFENLRTQLTELELTFSGCLHESEFGFNFNNTVKLANKEPDLQKRKQIYLDAYAAYNMYWIESELCFPKETEEYKSQLEHFKEFCFGCQKAIETIDYQLQNIPLSTKKDFKLIYESELPRTNVTSSTKNIVNTVKPTFVEKEKILSRYLEAVESALRAFMIEMEPQNEDVLVIATNVKQFKTALNELYFSDNPNKEEYYTLLHSEISRATFYINDDNLFGRNPNIWKPICHALNIVQTYTSELRFKETNYYFPFKLNSSDDIVSTKEAIENDDFQNETDYTQIHINDFCNFLLGNGNAQLFVIDNSKSFSKTKMYDYIKVNTDNFNPGKLKYFIEDLRDFSNNITFNLKKSDYSTIECDNITGECIEFLSNGLPAKSYHFSINNDFTPEQIENCFFNKVDFDKGSTLIERINLLKASIPNIHFPGTLTKLFQFSDIAEEEYSKISGSINVVISTISEQFSNNEVKLDQFTIKTKFHKLKENLSNYGFYDLPMIKSLTHPKKEELISIMSTNSIDYCIAMFDYLGYIKHLKPLYFDSVKELNTEIALWLGSNERDIQGQISRLKPSSREKKPEYKSYLEVENVKIDYNRIKNS